MATKTLKALASLVDELGTIKAQADTLAKREKEIKAALIATGRDVVNGDLFRATITECDREMLDRASVEAVLAPEAFKKCLKTTTVTTVRVNSRSAAQTLRVVAA